MCTCIVEADRQSLSLEELVSRLRYVTLDVQILPFIYSLLFTVSMILYLTCPDSVSRVCDYLFYISPVTMAAFLILSKLLKMCIWHKTACLLPFIPQVFSFIDMNIYQFHCESATATITITLSMAIFLLVAAYKVFFK